MAEQLNPKPRTTSRTKKKTTELNPDNRGIFILALGHPFYGRMAFNLAVSIRNQDPTVKIAIGYSGESLKELFRYNITEVVTDLIEVPIECTLKRGHVENLRAKLEILNISPYDYTLFLDADTIWSPGKPASQLMDLLMDVEFTIQTKGHVDMANKEQVNAADRDWCHPRDIKNAYAIKTGLLFTIYSEFMWIAKTERNTRLFETALSIYDNPRVDFLEFAGGMPDELPLSIAMTLLKIQPHQLEFIPIYWEHREKLQLHQKPELLNTDFWLYSIGGKVTPAYVKNHYNHLAAVAFQIRGLRYPYTATNKREFLPERAKI